MTDSQSTERIHEIEELLKPMHANAPDYVNDPNFAPVDVEPLSDYVSGITIDAFASRYLLLEVVLPAVRDEDGNYIADESPLTDLESTLSHCPQVHETMQVTGAIADEAQMEMEYPIAAELLDHKEFEKVRRAYEQVVYLRSQGWTITPPAV
jgi:hypothetical protein